MTIKDQLKNDLAVLSIIMLALQTVVAKEDDGAVRCGRAKRVTPEDLDRVKASLQKISALYQKTRVEMDMRSTAVAVREICDCPIHVETLKQAGISTLSDLYDSDPLQLRHLLKESESKNGGVAHYELYCGIRFHVEQMAKLADVSPILPRNCR